MLQPKEAVPTISNNLEVQAMENQELFDSLLESLGQLGGSKSKQFGEMILNQLGSSCHLNKEAEDILLNVVEDIKGIAPKDSIEGMLAIQMIATHYASMNCLSQAAQVSSSERRQENLNAAN